MTDSDFGGDPPCWAHMLCDDDSSDDSMGDSGPSWSTWGRFRSTSASTENAAHSGYLGDLPAR